MPYNHYFTPLCLSDIDETLDYISNKLSNPSAASSLYSKIEEAILGICDFPMAYPDCKYYLISDNNIRHVIIENYVLIYEIDEREKNLKLLRFLYSGRNISNLPTT